MANQKISQLTEKTTLDWWEEIPFAENWGNGKFTTENLKEQILDEVDALPSQEWNDWKFLKTDWENASWETIDVLPSQTGNNWKFLKTNGTMPSRDNIPTELPSQTWQAWKVLTTNWTEASRETPTWWISTLPWSPIDLKYKWNWSKAQFEALGTYRADTEYNVVW